MKNARDEAIFRLTNENICGTECLIATNRIGGDAAQGQMARTAVLWIIKDLVLISPCKSRQSDKSPVIEEAFQLSSRVKKRARKASLWPSAMRPIAPP
ncbi:MAG: hypothetical protein JO058_21440 [Alphaproteobacteria bacterium]|nr:hypothetical protein [Alphaproteobacteria bacterium]